MTDTNFCDISEFQPNIDQLAYYNAGHRVFIFRTHSGYRPDKIMPARLQATRRVPFTAVGLYQYLVKDRDPTQQAHEFVSGIGQLAPNEFPICDCEEDAPGSDIDRCNAWFKVVDAWAGFLATLYSGDSFLRTNLGGSAHWGRRPIWVAAYQRNEPTQRHTYWQNTDKASFPGINGRVDGNIYHGTPSQFFKDVRGSAAPQPVPKPTTGEQSMVSIVKPNGAIETFVEEANGEVVHRWQKAENSGDWGSGWSSLGTPGR